MTSVDVSRRWAAALLVVLISAAGAFAQRTVTVDRGAYDPAVSPAGKAVVAGILGKIWIVPIGCAEESTKGCGTPRQIGFGNGWDEHPAWSPDGRLLAYAHNGPVGSEIVRYNLDTGESLTLYGRAPGFLESIYKDRPFGPLARFGPIAFHPTKPVIYFLNFHNGLWSVPVSGGSTKEVIASARRTETFESDLTEEDSFAFSPDGLSLAVQKEKDMGSGWSQIFVTPVESISLTQVTGQPTVHTTEVNWNRDGSLVYIERAGATESLVVQPIAGGQNRRFALGAFNGRQLRLLPDGESAILVSGRQLFRLKLNSGKVTPIPFRATFTLPTQVKADLTIINARLFDATGDNAVEHSSVEIRDGQVARVVKGASRSERGVGARVIDAHGKFLMPGLTDAHMHYWIATMFTDMRAPLIGITTIFDPGSYLPETLNERDAVKLGLMEGPDMYTVGPILEGEKEFTGRHFVQPLTRPEEAVAEVQELKRQGVDGIKLYAMLEPDVTRAAIVEGNALGLPVIGDLLRTSWGEAVDAGIHGLLHMHNYQWELLAHDDRKRAILHGPIVEPDFARFEALFSKMATKSTMLDPTMMAASRQFTLEEFKAARDSKEGEAGRKVRILSDLFLRANHAGVQFVTGTDGSPRQLLDELKIWEEVGIPNAVILRASTANLAKYLYKKDLGTVEPGKRANLILVDGDPLKHISDLQNIALVVKNGRIVMEQ